MKKFLGICVALTLLLFLATSCATAPAKPSVDAAPATTSDSGPGPAPLPPPRPVDAEPPQPEVSIPAQVDAWAGASASTRELVSKVDALAKEGSWKSAWALLDTADPKRMDPYILARSIDLMLDGYIDTAQHLSFMLDDLPPNLTSAMARSAATGIGEIDFSPGDLADAQVAGNVAAVPVLDRALGRYYAEAGRLYAGKWLLPDDEVAKRALEHFALARTAGVYDIASLQAEAEALLNVGGLPTAEAILVAAEKLDPGAVRVRYDHAVALLMQRRAQEALPLVESGLADDKDPSSRLSAYTIGAQAASLSGDDARAEAYLQSAEKDSPDRPEPGLFRHYLAVMKGESQASIDAGLALLVRFGPNPQLISSLVGTWFQNGDPDSALSFLDAALQGFAGSDDGSGALGFYKAMVLLQTAADASQLEEVGPVLDAAEASFKKAYPPEHPVFGIIANIREELAGKIAEAQSAEAGPVAGPQLPEGQTSASPSP